MPYDELQYPRFGGLSVQDDDEEERRRLRLQDLGDLQRFAMTAPPQAQPARAQLSALIAPRDPEMDSRWRNAEQTALDRSGYAGNQPYGAGEAVRDFAPMAVGGVLDVLLNKGRGLGYIAAAGANANQIEAAKRQREAAAAGDFALSARNQRESMKNGPLDAAYKQAQIENWQAQDERARANIANRDRNTSLREIMQQYKLDPNNPEAVKKAQLIQELSSVDVSGLSNEAQKAIQGLITGNQTLQNAGPIADARNASDVAHARPKAAEAAIGGEEGKLAAAPTTAATNLALGNVPEVTARGQSYATQYAKDNDAALKTLAAAHELLSSAKPGQDIPGLSRADTALGMLPGGSNFLSDDAKKTQQLKAIVQEFFSRDQSGAAIAKSEQKNFLYELFGDPTTSAQAKQAALQRFVTTVVEPALRSRAAANPDAAQSVIDATGVPFSVRPPAAPASKYADPGYRPDVLDVTGRPGVRNTPDFPGGAPVSRLGGGRTQAMQTPVGGQAAGGSVNGGAPRMHTLSAPGKPPLQKMLTDEDVERLRAKGVQVD